MEKPNKLERSILIEIAKEYPELGEWIDKLEVSKREYTGVGSYTDFAPIPKPIIVKGNLQILNLSKLIDVPGIEYGLGAHIEMVNGIPKFLEIYTFGPVNWDGTYNDFTIKEHNI